MAGRGVTRGAEERRLEEGARLGRQVEAAGEGTRGAASGGAGATRGARASFCTCFTSSTRRGAGCAGAFCAGSAGFFRQRLQSRCFFSPGAVAGFAAAGAAGVTSGTTGFGRGFRAEAGAAGAGQQGRRSSRSHGGTAGLMGLRGNNRSTGAQERSGSAADGPAGRNEGVAYSGVCCRCCDRTDGSASIPSAVSLNFMGFERTVLGT